MSNCPASEMLKQRRIPAFVTPNDESEAICKLPAKIPSMAASDIQSTYNFRPDEINEPISPYTIQLGRNRYHPVRRKPMIAWKRQMSVLILLRG